ncbi:hypothetical protein BDV18DRAFT_40226 [Aspergillus unguis]
MNAENQQKKKTTSLQFTNLHSPLVSFNTMIPHPHDTHPGRLGPFVLLEICQTSAENMQRSGNTHNRGVLFEYTQRSFGLMVMVYSALSFSLIISFFFFPWRSVVFHPFTCYFVALWGWWH